MENEIFNDRFAEPAETPENSILEEAKKITYGDRNHQYGSPADNHARTAEMWSTYLGVPITSRDVCMLNVLQKVSRDRHRAKRDNAVDIAGFADNAERCPKPPTEEKTER